MLTYLLGSPPPTYDARLATPITLGAGGILAGPERFELPTAGFEDQNSSTELRTDGTGARART